MLYTNVVRTWAVVSSKKSESSRLCLCNFLQRRSLENQSNLTFFLWQTSLNLPPPCLTILSNAPSLCCCYVPYQSTPPPLHPIFDQLLQIKVLLQKRTWKFTIENHKPRVNWHWLPEENWNAIYLKSRRAVSSQVDIGIFPTKFSNNVSPVY